MFTWIKNQASAFYQSVSTAVSTTYTVITAVGSAVFSKPFRAGLSDWLTQSMQGFWRAINPANFTMMMKSDKSSPLYLRGMATFLLRAAPHLLYRQIIKPGIKAALDESHPVAGTVVVSALDTMAFWLMVRNTYNGFVDSAQNNLSMAKASAVDSKPEAASDNPLVTPCAHGRQANITAAATSTVHFYGTLMAIYGFANSIPYGDLIALPLEMLLIGRNTLEYPLAAAGNCAEHRLEVLNKNNPYALGVGASYVAVDRLLRYGLIPYAEKFIEQQTGLKSAGVSGFFLDRVMSAMLSMHFIMAANLNRDTKLPGKQPGVDLFEPCRDATDAFVGSVAKKVAKLMEGPPQENWYQETANSIRGVISKPVLQFLIKLIVQEDLRDWDKFKVRPQSKIFFDLYGKMLLEGIDFIRRKRRKTTYKQIHSWNQWANKDEKDQSFLQVKSLGKYLTSMGLSAIVSNDDMKMLDFLLQPELEQPLNEWYEYIKSAIPDQTAKYVVNEANLEVVEDYFNQDAKHLVKERTTVVEVKVLAAAPPSHPVPVAVVSPTPPVAQATNFRLFPDTAPKPVVSMQANTDKTLEDLARIISQTKPQ